mmetsp:Transcript_84295/g.176420  ORF Transcript_84295/g.176420 Transcript_84295/m.176420 type:complete len:107 (-) Transcript_84295:1901-2221(-)
MERVGAELGIFGKLGGATATVAIAVGVGEAARGTSLDIAATVFGGRAAVVLSECLSWRGRSGLPGSVIMRTGFEYWPNPLQFSALTCTSYSVPGDSSSIQPSPEPP